MSFTVFLGNLPVWVTADDIKQWLAAEDLVADSVKVIRNHETQESKGFAFIEAPTSDEMQAIIRRFDRAPLEDKVLRANPAQPSKGAPAVVKGPGAVSAARPETRTNEQRFNGQRTNAPPTNRPPAERRGGKKREQEPKSAFATELAKVL
jgi:RNA recognition motif-containing protein